MQNYYSLNKLEIKSPSGILCNTWGASRSVMNIYSSKPLKIYISMRFMGKVPGHAWKLITAASKNHAAAAAANTSSLHSSRSSTTPNKNAEVSESSNVESSNSNNQTPSKEDASTTPSSPLGPLKDNCDLITEKVITQPTFNFIRKTSNDIKQNLEEEESSISLEPSDTYKAVYVNEPYGTILPHNLKFEGLFHDPDHVFIAKNLPNNSLELVAQATSAKGGTPEGDLENIKVSCTKYDGSFIPQQRNLKPGMDENNNVLPRLKSDYPLNDDYANTVPDKNKGGQYVKPLPQTRVLTEEEAVKVGVEENKGATVFFNTEPVKAIIDEIYKVNSNDMDPSIIISQDSFDELTYQTNDVENISTDIVDD